MRDPSTRPTGPIALELTDALTHPVRIGFLALFAASCAENVIPVAVVPVILLAFVFGGSLILGQKVPLAGKLMLSIFCYSIVSALVSGLPLNAFWTYRFLRNDGKFFFAYVPFLAALLMRHTQRELRLMTSIWILGCLIPLFFLTVSILLPGAGIGDTLFETTPAGVSVFHGFFVAHTATGSFYAIAFVFAICLARVSRRAWLLYLCALVILVGLILSLSRAFVVGAGIAFLLEAVIRKKWKMVMAATGIGVVLLVSIGGVLLNRLELGKEDPSAIYNVEVRLALWARAVQYIKTSPILGIGFSRFDDDPDTFSGIPGVVAFKNVSGPIQTVDGDAEWSMEAHNNYLQILAEEGVLGLGLWVLFWTKVLKPIYRCYINSPYNSFRGAWTAACLCSCVAVFIASFFDLDFWAPAAMLPLGWALGAALSSDRIARPFMASQAM